MRDGDPTAPVDDALLEDRDPVECPGGGRGTRCGYTLVPDLNLPADIPGCHKERCR
jgi:hypothetical protein